jgi:hypothetical protein
MHHRAKKTPTTKDVAGEKTLLIATRGKKEK